MADFFRPATYLTPAEMAYVDRLEAEIRDAVNGSINAFVDVINTGKGESISLWAELIPTVMNSRQMSYALAYFFLEEAKRRIADDR